MEPIQRWYAVLVGGVALSIMLFFFYVFLQLSAHCTVDRPCYLLGLNVQVLAHRLLAFVVFYLSFVGIIITIFLDRPKYWH